MGFNQASINGGTLLQIVAAVRSGPRIRSPRLLSASWSVSPGFCAR